MNSTERFASVAASFQSWAMHCTDTGYEAVRTALLTLTRLYLAALELPPSQPEESGQLPEAARVGDAEWKAVLVSAKRLPFDWYSQVFDPFTLPGDEPVIGSLADDLADIYRDVVTGLRAWEAGEFDAAVRQWKFYLEIHWGCHATSAIQALQTYLTLR